MINAIINAIVKAIHDEFGDEYEIYTEEMEQGLKEPCFSIFCINPTIRQFLGKKYFRQNSFMVLYFPSSVEEPMNEINEVVEKLFKCLELINDKGDLIRGTNMNPNVVDGVLNFNVNYDLFTYDTKVDDPMEEMDDSTSVIEG